MRTISVSLVKTIVVPACTFIFYRKIRKNVPKTKISSFKPFYQLPLENIQKKNTLT